MAKHRSIWSCGMYRLSPVPDFASMDNMVAVLLFTATISGSPVLEPPNLLAFQCDFKFILFTNEYS